MSRIIGHVLVFSNVRRVSAFGRIRVCPALFAFSGSRCADSTVRVGLWFSEGAVGVLCVGCFWSVERVSCAVGDNSDDHN
jgi:hypothetical protein